MLPFAKTSEIAPGKCKSAVVEGTRVAVFHTGSGFFAIEDRCTHAEVRLSDGWVEGTCVACPWHGAQFDLQTGEALSGPAILPTRSFPLQIVDDVILVDANPVV
ncbi:MAG: 3-phenylpropionate [Verrucomicrobia bacterium]|jgi:nitrite reductase/ring-hydroxylating ferredoxin subunit|nr:MAG: 3-phenylpropionate [Verrucomicrobiota bacterium]